MKKDTTKASGKAQSKAPKDEFMFSFGSTQIHPHPTEDGGDVDGEQDRGQDNLACVLEQLEKNSPYCKTNFLTAIMKEFWANAIVRTFSLLPICSLNS